MDISVIIVNWNARELLINCLSSVYKTINGLSFEIWVVDNGSTDGSLEATGAQFPKIEIISNKKNLGFAKANNQALRIISGRYAVLLNSDTVLTDGAINILVEFMDRNETAGICGGQLLNADGSKQNSIANIPTLATELLNKSLLRKLFPQKYPGKEQDFREPVEVESVIGACMVVRRKAIEETGLMDEDYFFFLEETDWCLNMRKNGWKVFHHPEAKIYHLQGQSVGKVNERARIEYWISRYIFFLKNYGRTKLIFLKSGLLTRLAVAILLLLVQNLLCFFIYKKAKNKLKLNLRLMEWHLKGCPLDYGLRGRDNK